MRLFVVIAGIFGITCFNLKLQPLALGYTTAFFLHWYNPVALKQIHNPAFEHDTFERFSFRFYYKLQWLLL